MTDTEAKALVRSLMLIATNKALPINYRDYATGAAHYIEATEARHAAELREQAERFEAFRQEVSDAVEDVRDNTAYDVHPKLWRFITPKPKPDPLVEVLKEADAPSLGDDGYEAMAERVHAAMQARGYEWRKIGADQ